MKRHKLAKNLVPGDIIVGNPSKVYHSTLQYNCEPLYVFYATTHSAQSLTVTSLQQVEGNIFFFSEIVLFTCVELPGFQYCKPDLKISLL